MDTNDAATEPVDDLLARRVQSLERELMNAKNNVRRLQIQLSELKQRQRNRSTARSRIAELFLASSATGKRQGNPGD